MTRYRIKPILNCFGDPKWQIQRSILWFFWVPVNYSSYYTNRDDAVRNIKHLESAQNP